MRRGIFNKGILVKKNAGVSNVTTELRTNVRLYILCHNEQRLTEALQNYKHFDWAKPILMTYQDLTFENAFWKQLGEIYNEWNCFDMVGTLSANAIYKINIDVVDRIIKNKQIWETNGYYNFSNSNNLIRNNEHPHLLTIMRDICLKLGVSIPTESTCNFWMCTPVKMVEFIKWFETVAKPIVLNHPLALTDSKYNTSKTLLSSDQLIKLWGKPFYPHVPFVFERLNKVFFENIIHEQKCGIDNISYIPNSIYIIGGVNGGGSLKFINDFKKFFTNAKHIKTKKELLQHKYNVNDILFIQHLYKTDILFSTINNLYNEFKFRLIVSIHDFSYLSNSFDHVHNAHLSDINDITIEPEILTLFLNADKIIHPSLFTYNIYKQYFQTENFVISPHIDFKIIDSQLRLPTIINNTINIGIFTDNSICKGKEYIQYIKETFKQINGYTINYINPKYNENEFFEIIKKQNIHCLLALNKWGETYGYALTKFLKSGLPILFNNVGSFKERIPNKPYYIKVLEEENQSLNDLTKQILKTQFLKIISLIMENSNKNIGDSSEMIDLSLTVPKLYKFIFISEYYDNKIWKNIYKQIKPFCIYFPQFHQIKENDENYYPGMTDMKNLIQYLKDEKCNIDYPEINAYNLISNEEYDQSNKSLVLSQITCAKQYGMYGFCIYYYWFSTNTITHKQMIMDKCINNFFQDNFDDFKIFFNWANEDWTNNPAFNTGHDISNKYTTENIILNFNNLVNYFKHPNYYKINNYPIFYIHHPWLIPNDELQNLSFIFNKLAKEHGFNGIHIVLNSMKQQNPFFPSFGFVPNYIKHTTHENNYISLNDIKHTPPTSIFFTFNNIVRMYKSKMKKNIIITGSSQIQQKIALYNSIKEYNISLNEYDKIFLINSWNEWGENMAIEPGVINKNFYLALLKSILFLKYCPELDVHE